MTSTVVILCVVRRVGEGCNKPAAVGDCELKSCGCRSFIVTSVVVGENSYLKSMPLKSASSVSKEEEFNSLKIHGTTGYTPAAMRNTAP